MICCSLISSTVDGMLQQIIKAKSTASIIEIRLDYLSSPTREDIMRLLSSKTCPLIVTCRKKEEGGNFQGSEKERIELLKASIECGADYVDIELSSGKKIIDTLIKKKNSAKIIVSYHNFKGFPENIDEIYETLKKAKADIIKISCTANMLSDNLRLFDVLKKAKNEKVSMIGMCMGEKGEISRILNIAYGSWITFGSYELGKESAPGQITCEYLKRVYRADQLKAEHLKIYGLIGNPVSKSKGYIVHNLMFKEARINAVYLNFLIEDVKGFLSSFRDFIDGLSVTMPYKEEVIPFLDAVDDTAKRIGAVNTIVKRNGQLIGYNTDMSGAMKAIEEKISIAGKNIILIGAGGAARAIAYGILKRKGNLCIANRTVAKAKQLAEELGCNYSSMNSLDFGKANILINATSIGMSPKTNESPVNGNSLRNMVVFDVVYSPLITKLLHDAERNRCTIICGVQMFIHQAADQFELWTAKKADREILEESVLQYVVNG